MRIIGRGANGTMIVEATEAELRNLAGFRHYDREKMRLEVGSELQISRMWEQLEELAHKRRELEQAAAACEGAAAIARKAGTMIPDIYIGPTPTLPEVVPVPGRPA